jgi:serine/threonine-protein phosphatase 5
LIWKLMLSSASLPAGEVTSKVDQGPAFALFTECFNWIPLAAVLGRRVLVVHGGLFSRDDVKLDELRRVDRNQQPPDSGLMCEMMWSDPMPMPGRAPSKRGTALQFGPDVTKKFLALNGLGTAATLRSDDEGRPPSYTESWPDRL